MHPINQRSHLSALAAKVVLLTFLSWILILPVPAGLSDSPKHWPQYEQLQSSIVALSAEIASITRTIDTLKDTRGRTTQTAPPQSHHLQTTIQDLTEKVATLQTQVQDLGCQLTGLRVTVDALALTIKGDTPDTGVTQTISKLSDRVGKLEGTVGSLTSSTLSDRVTTLDTKVQQFTSQQDTDFKKLVFLCMGALLGFVGGLLGVWAKKLIWEDREQEKERAKEKLEKFYAPVLGRLQANEDIWANFTREGSIANPEEQNRIKTENPCTATASGTQAKKKEALDISENILKDILKNNDNDRRSKRLEVWVRAMEGIFRQNNEAAEKTILENYGYLRPEDLSEESDFNKERKKYLRHVGEFKAVLNRWDEARKDTRYQNAKNWYDRYRKSYSLDIDEDSSRTLAEQDFLNYFHPTNPYRKEFLEEVKNSYDKLMDEAGLAKQNDSAAAGKSKRSESDVSPI